MEGTESQGKREVIKQYYQTKDGKLTRLKLRINVFLYKNFVMHKYKYI